MKALATPHLDPWQSNSFDCYFLPSPIVSTSKKPSQESCLTKLTLSAEKNHVDLDLNIAGELEGLKKNLDAYKASGGGGGEFDEVKAQKKSFHVMKYLIVW